MMLHMLVKFNQRFSPELKDKIASNLQKAVVNGDSLIEDMKFDDEGQVQSQLQE